MVSLVTPKMLNIRQVRNSQQNKNNTPLYILEKKFVIFAIRTLNEVLRIKTVRVNACKIL